MRLMSEFKPDIVFHAAALKHVPILERDWSEGVKTNIFGSVNVADAALAAGAEAMVMISTDKAIEPVSMLGLTKRFAEMYCQALDHDLTTESAGKPRMRLIWCGSAMCWRRMARWCRSSRLRSRRAGRSRFNAPRHGSLFHDDPRGLRSRAHGGDARMTPARPDVSVYVLNMGQPVRSSTWPSA